jgi:hypothetical protein
MITEYEVGQIPARPLGVIVKDDNDDPVNLLVYSTYEIELLGSDNEQVDLTGVQLHTEGARNGILAIIWPKDRSLFEKRGEYLLRLVLRDSEGSRDYTRTHTLNVREFGRFN